MTAATAEVFKHLSLDKSALPPSGKTECTSEELGCFSPYVRGADHGPMFEHRRICSIFEALREWERETGELPPAFAHLLREIAGVIFEALREWERETGELPPAFTHLLRESASITLRAEAEELLADKEVDKILKDENLGPEEREEALNEVFNRKFHKEMEANRRETERLNQEIREIERGLPRIETVEEEEPLS